MFDKNSPKVFAKVVAGLHKSPQEAEVALSYAEDARVYAIRVDGASGMDILHGFVAERQGAAAGSVPPPTVSVGGKQVTRIGSIAGAPSRRRCARGQSSSPKQMPTSRAAITVSQSSGTVRIEPMASTSGT
jgi:hypothetical protein